MCEGFGDQGSPGIGDQNSMGFFGEIPSPSGRWRQDARAEPATVYVTRWAAV